MILNQLQFFIGDKLSSRHYGLIKGKGTHKSIQECVINPHARCYIFVDLKGVFDRANKQVILHKLFQHISGTLFQLIEDYMDNRTAAVFFEGHLLQVRDSELGTPQGVLSPTLFNILMNGIAELELPATCQLQIYADDILLQGRQVEDTRRALHILEAKCNDSGLVIAPQKTKVVVHAQDPYYPFRLQGHPLKAESAYKYL